MKKTVLFSTALDKAKELSKPILPELGMDITLVRDLLGRIRILLPGKRSSIPTIKQKTLFDFEQSMSQSLLAYGHPPERMALFEDELFLDHAVMKDDRRFLHQENGLTLWLMDRQIIGQDWGRPPLRRHTQNQRFTFFSIKGGVGRSTVLTLWAWHLAKQGKNVLVFDFDLESPGVSSTLLSPEHLPDYGLVDWFVEDGVGQGEEIEGEMVANSPLAAPLAGAIRVVPAYGRKSGDYLPKLARCYAEMAGSSSLPWGERVERLVATLEQKYRPDVVFLDSRAGLHDIAAVLATRMGADTLLFAVDSPQTWTAYSFLFRHWQTHPEMPLFRDHLKIVAAMVPETGREKYLNRFCEHAWDLFRDYLYDEEEANNLDAFNFNLLDEDAPHFPLPVFWHRSLQEFDPTANHFNLDEILAAVSLKPFLEKAELLLMSQERTP